MSICLQEIRSFDRRSLRKSSTDEKMGIVVVEELTDDVLENSEQVAAEHENETLPEIVESDKFDKNSLKRSSDDDFENSGQKRQKSEVFDKSSEMLETHVSFFEQIELIIQLEMGYI